MKNKQQSSNKLPNLKAYQLAIELTNEIEEITKSWDNNLNDSLSHDWLVDMRLITSQMDEAYQQQAFEGHSAFLWEAIGALARSTVSLEMSHELGFLDDSIHNHLKQRFYELEMQLKGLAYSLRKIFGK